MGQTYARTPGLMRPCSPSCIGFLAVRAQCCHMIQHHAGASPLCYSACHMCSSACRPHAGTSLLRARARPLSTKQVPWSRAQRSRPPRSTSTAPTWPRRWPWKRAPGAAAPPRPQAACTRRRSWCCWARGSPGWSARCRAWPPPSPGARPASPPSARRRGPLWLVRQGASSLESRDCLV